MFLFLLFVLICTLYYLKVWKVQHRWQSDGVPCLTPIYPIFGNMLKPAIQVEPMPDLFLNTYMKHKDQRYIGFYQFLSPTLIINDPELIKQITIKSFDHFVDRRPFLTEKTDPLFGRNLFALTGNRWRDMRATLSPVFTGSKLRAMYTLINETSVQFCNYFLKELKNTDNNLLSLEMKDTFTRFTNDVIATTAFGITCQSLEVKDNEFYEMGKDASNFSGLRAMKVFMYNVSPKLMSLLKVQVFPESICTFFRTIIKDSMETREKQGIVRPDLIHLLMEAKKGRLQYEEAAKHDAGFATVDESAVGKSAKAAKRELTDDDITAQALLFFLAGFDASATLLCYIAHELAENPDIQEKLYREVRQAKLDENGHVSYETLLGLKYMDMVVSETLRKWPPAFGVDRSCVKPYTIEPKLPGEAPVKVEIGDTVFFPIYGIHRDPKYFPNPDKFDPERFSEENRSSIDPNSFIPFGSGPRNCIGSRLALLEAKSIVFNTVRNFEIVFTEKTQSPIKLSKKHFNMTPENGFWLGFRARNK